MDRDQVWAVISECSFNDYRFSMEVDGRGAWYLQAIYVEPDVLTGEAGPQLTRRWFLSPEMSVSEIVQTAFKCVLTSMEHRTREFFRYRGRAVFGPHMDIEALWELAEEGRQVHRG